MHLECQCSKKVTMNQDCIYRKPRVCYILAILALGRFQVAIGRCCFFYIMLRILNHSASYHWNQWYSMQLHKNHVHHATFSRNSDWMRFQGLKSCLCVFVPLLCCRVRNPTVCGQNVAMLSPNVWMLRVATGILGGGWRSHHALLSQ